MTKKTSFDWRYLAMAALALCLVSLTTTASAGPPIAPTCCVCSCANGVHCLQALGTPNCPVVCEQDVRNTTCSGGETVPETFCEDIPACTAGGTNPAAAPAMGPSVLVLTAVLLSILGIWRARRRRS